MDNDLKKFVALAKRVSRLGCMTPPRNAFGEDLSEEWTMVHLNEYYGIQIQAEALLERMKEREK